MVFEGVQQAFSLRNPDVFSLQINLSLIAFSFLVVCTAFPFSTTVRGSLTLVYLDLGVGWGQSSLIPVCFPFESNGGVC